MFYKECLAGDQMDLVNDATAARISQAGKEDWKEFVDTAVKAALKLTEIASPVKPKAKVSSQRTLAEFFGNLQEVKGRNQR